MVEVSWNDVTWGRMVNKFFLREINALRIMRSNLRRGSASAMRILRSSRPTANPSTKPPPPPLFEAFAFPFCDAKGEMSEAVRKSFKIKFHGKDLELLQQTEEMKVYVNPDEEGLDEWVCGNQKLLVGSPKPQSRTEAIAARGG